MVSALATLPLLRQHIAAEEDLLTVVVNARSRVEANLALGILREKLPEKVLVAALNLREVLDSLPAYPCSMAVDEAMLARVSGLKKIRSAWTKTLADDDGIALNVTTAGNFCFDLVLEIDGTTYFWTPSTADEDIVNPGLLAMLLDRKALLPAVIALAKDMGLVFNPRFYMSLDDWNLDHLQDSFEDLQSLF
ncbi:MAG: hypothetical protein Q8S43_01395 [Actinomycetota bacterium]|nr:MAG: hypothetical protein FD171_965 [Actinomycetota bacterium]MDO8949201.1 hypothetical protein [Actinomycetota bacterium]MDP3629595.1 hypothetical protein [Actinomycetota bacterium]